MWLCGIGKPGENDHDPGRRSRTRISDPRANGSQRFERRRASASSSSTARWERRFRTSSLDERDFRGDRFIGCECHLQGNNDLLTLTQPQAIEDILFAYAMAGADILETNTFSSTRIAQADYGMQDVVYELNRDGARLARRAALKAERLDGKPRFVAGALGPTNRTASLSPDVNNPGFRAVTFDDLREAYAEQIGGLIDGGADIILIETIFDTLNAKAAIFACEQVFAQRGRRLPVMISGTITDRSGRTLSGQTPTAFWHSVRHARPFSIGLNCALGADGDARTSRGNLRRRRDLRLRLSERRPAQRIRPLRRDAGADGRLDRRLRARRARQHRRRLLRLDARTHQGDRRASGHRARDSRIRAADASSGLEPFTLTKDIPFVNIGDPHPR